MRVSLGSAGRMRGRIPDRGSVLFLLSQLALVLGAPVLAADAPSVHQVSACLSISPLRALPSARLDTAQGAWWRDRLVDSLKPRLGGTMWRLAAAGNCPEGLPTLDVFQQPGDLSRDQDGSLVKLRFEWRHRPGTTLAILDDPDHPETRTGLWASQVMVAANLQLGRISVTAPRPATVSHFHGSSWKTVGETPQEWAQPPGQLRLRLEFDGDSPRDIDTLLEAGQTLKLNFVPSSPAPARNRRSRWAIPLWSASALCLIGGLWYSLEMERAYSRYARLDSSNSAQDFDDSWGEVRQTNILRNALLASSVGFMAGALYVHF